MYWESSRAWRARDELSLASRCANVTVVQDVFRKELKIVLFDIRSRTDYMSI